MLVLLGGVDFMLGLEVARAAAWTQARGDFTQISTVRYARATDRLGAPAGGSAADFRKYEYAFYGEYGLLPRLTIVLNSPYQWLRDGASGEDVFLSGAGDNELAARFAVWRGSRGAASLQTMIGLPGEASGGGADPLLARGLLYEARGLAGFSRRWRGRDGFANVETAYRWRRGAAPNEWRFDATLGASPTENWQVFAQSFSTASAGGARAPFESFRSHKVELSVLRRFGRRFGVQAGLSRSVAGRDVLQENGAFIALWVSGAARAPWRGRHRPAPTPSGPPPTDCEGYYKCPWR